VLRAVSITSMSRAGLFISREIAGAQAIGPIDLRLGAYYRQIRQTLLARADDTARSQTALPGSCIARAAAAATRPCRSQRTKPVARTVCVSSRAPARPAAGTISPASTPTRKYNPAVAFTMKRLPPLTVHGRNNPHHPKKKAPSPHLQNINHENPKLVLELR